MEGIPEKVAQLQEQVNAHEKRITAHGLKIDSLNESVVQYHARTDEKLQRIDDTVSRIDHRLENEEQRPADSWRGFVRTIAKYALGGVVAILGGIVCVVLAKAGMHIL